MRSQNLPPPAIQLTVPREAWCLEEVSIKADFRGDFDGRGTADILSQWVTVDAGLSALPSIRRVTVYNCQTCGAAQPGITHAFPRLHAKSLLRVHATSGACIRRRFVRKSWGTDKVLETAGFLSEANETDLFEEAFRRHNMI